MTHAGELPPGVHSARLSEVLDRFGAGSAQRQAVALRLARIYRIAQASGHLARFVVFGSFVTAKREPADVDVFLLMEDAFDASRLTGEARSLFDHPTAQAWFGASVFWLRRLAAWEGEVTTIEHCLQAQVAHLRTVETNPANYRLSASGFLAEVDRMQLEVREYLSLHPADLRAGT